MITLTVNAENFGPLTANGYSFPFIFEEEL